MPEQPKITIVLLSYKRPQNIPIILDAIKAQTVTAAVFLWNNGTADVNFPLINRYEQSEINLGCMARWNMAKKASTPYVMSLDDDICFNRDNALESIVQSLEQQDDPNRIVGFTGACFNPVPNYNIRREYMCRYGNTNRQTCSIRDTYEKNSDEEVVYIKRAFVDRDEPVDIVKGRAMAFRRELLDDIDLPKEREDDIFLSAAFANRARKFHRIPTLLHDAFYELPQYGAASWTKSEHMPSRDRALKAYFR